jgi:hypothetical protein
MCILVDGVVYQGRAYFLLSLGLESFFIATEGSEMSRGLFARKPLCSQAAHGISVANCRESMDCMFEIRLSNATVLLMLLT